MQSKDDPRFSNDPNKLLEKEISKRNNNFTTINNWNDNYNKISQNFNNRTNSPRIQEISHTGRYTNNNQFNTSSTIQNNYNRNNNNINQSNITSNSNNMYYSNFSGTSNKNMPILD